jgi:hypothetical protein
MGWDAGVYTAIGLRKRVMALGVAVVTVAGMGVLAVAGQAANGIGGNFEIDTDANLVVDGASPAIDWLVGGTGTALRTGVLTKPDKDTGSGDDSFGQGSKEDTAVPTVVDGSIPPNKSDLKTFGLYKETAGNKSYLNLFWTRVQDPSGTTNMDFEFNKKQAKAGEGNGITPLRSVGDLLITYDLSNGGVNATMSIRRWTGSAWGPAASLAGTEALGTINSSAVNAADSGGLGSLSVRTFGEASIDLSRVFRAGACESFGSAFLKSRSSDTFSSAMKDFIAPMNIRLSNCGSIEITKVDDASSALSGAQFTLYKDVAPLGGTAAGTEDKTAANTVGTCTTGADGKCSFTDIQIGKYWVVETVTPANHNTAADQYVDITAGDQVVPLTFVNPRQPGTINVHKQDDAGGALNGAVFTLYADVAPFGGTRGVGDTVSLGTCTTSGAGDCSFTSVQLGQYWVVETTTPSGYQTAADQHVNLSTGGQTVSLTFVDKRYFKVIVLVCQQSNNELYASNVKFDGSSTPTTNNSLDTSTTPTEAQLCALGGATLSNVTNGSHSAAINIP